VKLRSGLSALFWGALAFTLVMALLPKPPHLPGDPSDKVQHLVAFAVLAAIASSAYARTGLIRVGAGLLVFGALIELLQAIPSLHRDSSLIDWIADCAAVTIVLLIVKAKRRFK
jgi:VanZ family protein